MRIAGKVFATAVLVAAGQGAQAAPILDGTGYGAATATVTYDSAAPTSNFASPGPTTAGASYDIFMKSDATYAYVKVKTNGGGGTIAGSFANLYFNVGGGSGSDYGIQVTNSISFTPSTNAPFSTAGTGISFALLAPGEIEVAFPWVYFESDSQGVGYSPIDGTNPTLQLRLSQSFGYSVAGGSTYGTNRLGVLTDPNFATNTPEPASLALLGAGLAGIAALRRRRK